VIKKFIALILDTIQVVIFAVSVFLFIYLLVLQPHKIKGHSMEPNFQDKEYLLTDKITYRFLRDPQRGDVVVFKAPPNYTDEYIKRIIGLPGEKIMVSQGKVYINGRALGESYLPAGLFISGGNYLQEGKVVTVPANSYVVLGDNRPHSLDSRAFGPVNFEKLTGRAWIVYWPLGEIGGIKEPVY
jgi:signal peptidase I